MATIATLTGVVTGIGTPGDVESDSTDAAYGTLNVKVKNTAGNSGFITAEPDVLANFSGVAIGDSVTITITDP